MSAPQGRGPHEKLSLRTIVSLEAVKKILAVFRPSDLLKSVKSEKECVFTLFGCISPYMYFYTANPQTHICLSPLTQKWASARFLFYFQRLSANWTVGKLPRFFSHLLMTQMHAPKNFDEGPPPATPPFACLWTHNPKIRSHNFQFWLHFFLY